ncbi:MAG: hypothetical protein Q7K11_01520 [Candidatus Berkelbacteria bacterium]|nr:hypothetical protein [Candidatus Berkelbacteria bacterium]
MKLKYIKDTLIKYLSGSRFLPEEVLTASEYFRHFNAINFDIKKDDGLFIATSTNFQWGTIATSGHSVRELDRNIKDAILTAFSVPSTYADKLKIHNVDERQKKYALA